MSEVNGNNPGGVTSKAHSPVPNEELGTSDKMAKLRIFRGDAEGGEEEEYEGGEICVGPMRAFPVIKDLVSDVSWNYEVSKGIKPFQTSEQAPFTMYEEDVERLYEPKKCIECFMCQDVCHVLRTHHKHPEFAGPRFFVRNQWLEMHPMDEADRLADLKEDNGLGYCNITKCCTEVCPVDIHITDNSIIPLKERVADEYYDPAKWLMRKVRGRPNPPTNASSDGASRNG